MLAEGAGGKPAPRASGALARSCRHRPDERAPPDRRSRGRGEMLESEAEPLLRVGWVKVDAGDLTDRERFCQPAIAGEPVVAIRPASPTAATRSRLRDCSVSRPVLTNRNERVRTRHI
jgi:hypothetical protein